MPASPSPTRGLISGHPC